MHKLFDLRFVIGAFFTVAGLLLLAYSFIVTVAYDASVNRWCGGIFAVFGILMIGLSFKKSSPDKPA